VRIEVAVADGTGEADETPGRVSSEPDARQAVARCTGDLGGRGEGSQPRAARPATEVQEPFERYGLQARRGCSTHERNHEVFERCGPSQPALALVEPEGTADARGEGRQLLDLAGGAARDLQPDAARCGSHGEEIDAAVERLGARERRPRAAGCNPRRRRDRATECTQVDASAAGKQDAGTRSRHRVAAAAATSR
jgi:hypothetical protein